jgi:hypothetical protein
MSKLPTYHIYHNGIPFTYLVFGPYANGAFDVEVFRGHVEYPVETYTFDEYGEIRPDSAYVGTVSDLTRDSHIVVDVWDWMDANV